MFANHPIVGDMDQINHSVSEGNPLMVLLNLILYVCSNILTTVLVITQDSLEVVQLLFTCAGILVSNAVLLIVNWDKIKKIFKKK